MQLPSKRQREELAKMATEYGCSVEIEYQGARLAEFEHTPAAWIDRRGARGMFLQWRDEMADTPAASEKINQCAFFSCNVSTIVR